MWDVGCVVVCGVWCVMCDGCGWVGGWVGGWCLVLRCVCVVLCEMCDVGCGMCGVGCGMCGVWCGGVWCVVCVVCDV